MACTAQGAPRHRKAKCEEPGTKYHRPWIVIPGRAQRALALRRRHKTEVKTTRERYSVLSFKDTVRALAGASTGPPRSGNGIAGAHPSSSVTTTSTHNSSIIETNYFAELLTLQCGAVVGAASWEQQPKVLKAMSGAGCGARVQERAEQPRGHGKQRALRPGSIQAT